MAKKKEAEAAAQPKSGEEGASKKKSPLLPALVVAIAVLGGGAMAGGIFGGGAEAAETGPEPQATATPAELGMVTELESVTLNLAGEGNHFLKLGIAIETGPEVTEPPPTAPVYDAIIDLFSGYTFADMNMPTTRDSTKDLLLTSLQGIYGDDIVRIYYTEFVMQ